MEKTLFDHLMPITLHLYRPSEQKVHIFLSKVNRERNWPIKMLSHRPSVGVLHSGLLAPEAGK